MKSIWMTETEIRKRDPLPGDMEVTAVVIGAGMAGILTAYYLQQAGVRTVVLEADRIGSGQTKNTTAKITSQHNLIYDRMIQAMGSRMAFTYAWANENAIEEYEKLITEKGIDCDFVRCPAYLYSEKEGRLLRREAEAAESIGIQASFETDCELPFPVAGAVKFEQQARFDPLKFLAAVSEDVTVYEQTKALKVEKNRVETDRGCVTAKYIIFACHYPFINVPGYYFAKMRQERSYVVALEGADTLEGMYLGIDRDGLSFRTQGELLLLGGGGHRTGMNRQGGQYEELRGRAQELYPGCHEVTCWSAQDCMTFDDIPYIGRFSSNRPDWYVTTGFGKWGMTTAMAGAIILTARITRQKCIEWPVFSPRRGFSSMSKRELAVHGAYAVKGWMKNLLPSKKDEIVPKCPHMGCRLEWNPEEETYDCPCHGSRFDREGKLIEGPAQTDCAAKR